jgi:hypothetical protein
MNLRLLLILAILSFTTFIMVSPSQEDNPQENNHVNNDQFNEDQTKVCIPLLEVHCFQPVMLPSSHIKQLPII